MARIAAVVCTQGNLINEKETSMNYALLMIDLRRVNYIPVFFAQKNK